MKQSRECLALDQLRRMDGRPVWIEETELYGLVSVCDHGPWKDVPFVKFTVNGISFEWNLEKRNLKVYESKPIDSNGQEDLFRKMKDLYELAISRMESAEAEANSLRKSHCFVLVDGEELTVTQLIDRYAEAMSMIEGSLGKSIWDTIRAAREAEEVAAEKLEELAELLESISEKWNEIAVLVSGAVRKEQTARYKPGVYIREVLANVSAPGQILDRLAQENKPPG